MTDPTPAATAGRWLTAAEVAVMAGAHVPRRAHCGYCLDPWPCDTAALLAQDARWRTLVGALLAWAETEAEHWDGRNADRYWQAQRMADEIQRQAQAALDGAEP